MKAKQQQKEWRGKESKTRAALRSYRSIIIIIIVIIVVIIVIINAQGAPQISDQLGLP